MSRVLVVVHSQLTVVGDSGCSDIVVVFRSAAASHVRTVSAAVTGRFEWAADNWRRTAPNEKG